MRIQRAFMVVLLPVLSWAVAACEADIDFRNPGGTKVKSTTSIFGPPGGVAPPPGRTPEERAARRDYYRGPRGDEF